MRPGVLGYHPFPHPIFKAKLQHKESVNWGFITEEMYCNKSKIANLTSFDPETYIQQFTFCNHQPRAWDLRQSYIHCNHYGSLFCNFNLKEITAIIQTHNLTINFLAAVIIKKLKKSVRQRNNQVSGELHVCLWNVRSSMYENESRIVFFLEGEKDSL